MTGAWFDAVVAALARARTRRAMIGPLASAVAARATFATVHVAAGQQCRGKRSTCRRNGQCCSGRCRRRKGTSKGRCRCSRYLEPCRKGRDCCPLDGAPLVCASETCQT